MLGTITDAAYPYAATETCVGHATISTGAFPATHGGMVANAWWDRKEQKMVTCTADPDPNVKNTGYAGTTPKGLDTAWRMVVPSFAEELKFQTSGATRIVSFSLKARAAITMAGHKALSLGKAAGTDFLAIGYSPVDYVGHEFGPRSREIQDILVRLDKDLGNLFAHLDQKVGHGNYVVALTADHGVVPIPEDMQSTGADAGLLHLPEVQERIEKALEPFNYAKPAVARITGSDIYFAPGVYEKLAADANAMNAAMEAVRTAPGVAAVYRAEELRDRPATQSPTLRAFANSYFPGRSGDLFILPKPYWLLDGTPLGKPRSYGTGHGVPYNYDQHVPILLMGFGIQPGQYFQPITPADIAPTFAALCGITLASRDGHVLAEALKKPAEPRAPSQPARAKSTPASAPNTTP